MARHLGTAALLVSLLISDLAWADGGWSQRRGSPVVSNSYGCLAWDGYQWLNMCYRSRAFIFPAWARFLR